jgi:hypothetical protein
MRVRRVDDVQIAPVKRPSRQSHRDRCSFVWSMAVTITSAGIDYRDDSQDRYKGVTELHGKSKSEVIRSVKELSVHRR